MSLPKSEQASQQSNLKQDLEMISEARRNLGPRLYQCPTLVDVAAGQHKVYETALAPTITSSRGEGQDWFFPWREQRVSVLELGRLQGRLDMS